MEDTEKTTSYLVEQTRNATTQAIADAEKAAEDAMAAKGEMEASELQRKQAEHERGQQEQTRQQQEQTRQQEFQSAEQSRQATFAASESARDTEFQSKESQRDAAMQTISQEAQKLTELTEKVEMTYNRGQIDALLNTKQNTLIPGNGISIDGNVISATVGGGGNSPIDLSDYAKKADVSIALEKKQDTISDLDRIREGARKGATALQSYTETDPIYMADKPKLALKSEIPDISGKADKTTIVTETEGNASYAILPNVLTKLGTLASSVTLSLDTSKEENGVTNVYDIVFTTPAEAPSITWPEGISWIGGSAPAIVGRKTYEVSIMDNLATYGEF